MTARSFIGNWHRHVLPVSLAFRLISITTPSSLAAAAEAPLIPDVLGPTQYAEQFRHEDFLAYTNDARISNGLAPLSISPELERAAREKVLDMAQGGYWDHFRPTDHKAPWDFIKENGYNYTTAGENLARGFASVKGITEAWLDSPTHRANVLSPAYKNVGFASIETTDEHGERVLLTVQMFGSR